MKILLENTKKIEFSFPTIIINQIAEIWHYILAAKLPHYAEAEMDEGNERPRLDIPNFVPKNVSISEDTECVTVFPDLFRDN